MGTHVPVSNMNGRHSRRRLLTGIAAGAGATVIGGLGLTRSPVARAADTFTITDTSVTLADGDASFVEVATDHQVTWRGFDVAVAAVAYVDYIKRLDDNGNVVNSHQLHDGIAKNGPTLLANFSTKGGSTGWGGDDEYASEDPDSYVEATGPTLAGFTHAGIDWYALVDPDHPPSDSPLSIEDPGDLDAFNISEVETDGGSKTATLRWVKEVHFFTKEDNGEPSVTTEDGTTVYPMGVDDGTRKKVASDADFDVTINNEGSSTDSSGDGTGSSG